MFDYLNITNIFEHSLSMNIYLDQTSELRCSVFPFSAQNLVAKIFDHIVLDKSAFENIEKIECLASKHPIIQNCLQMFLAFESHIHIQ